MRLAYLFLHSRQVERSLTLLGGVVVMTWAWQTARGGLGLDTGPNLVILPLIVAMIVPAGTSSPFGSLEATASRSLGPLRLAHVLGLLCVAALGLSVTSGSLDWAMIRNIAGLTGLGLIAARIAGPSLAWIAPLCSSIYALTASSRSTWNWPVHDGSAHQPALIAAVLLLSGLIVIVPHGAPTRTGTTE